MTSFKVRCYVCNSFVQLSDNGRMVEHKHKHLNITCRGSGKLPR